MRLFYLWIIGSLIFSCRAFAQSPLLDVPGTIEVRANGLRCVAFVAGLKGVPPEEREDFNISLKGLPAEAPLFFDEKNRFFFWCPRAEQAGSYRFDFVAEDRSGRRLFKSTNIKVIKAPSPEALPKGWADMKKEDQYLLGRKYLPSANFIEMEMAALPGSAVVITVLDSMDRECVLKYVPREGRAEVNKQQLSALVKLGAVYASDKPKKVRRDLYEDLYDTLGLIFKKIKTVEFRGGYLLEAFSVYDKPRLIGSIGAANIYMPNLNFSFDDRFYEKSLYSKKEPMMISDAPTIKVEFNTASGLIWRRGRLMIDETEYHAVRNEFSLVVVKPYKDISTFDVNSVMYLLRIPAVKKLPFGEHRFLFETENAYGMPIRMEAYARVVTLPAQIVGRPMVYPSPFNPMMHREVSIQYELSMQTNVEVVVFGVDGSTVMKQRFYMGEEGAQKGKNTISWDGKNEMGQTVSNGIYSGVIIDRDENRILEKFKIAVYR